ncbi:hypothetical protein B0H17DRAFT_1006365 [Mycena rosella]|uniref:NAD(P)-binding protein n=1 Tax=Mycena rosella TaxID=1033263 RepID=A0AAD7DV23_MYCRO|nr:hypothetical protein B0H17DRAFT_1006365 [Mycena rosella]
MGALGFLFGTFIPEQFFSNIPDTPTDLTGRTYLVTGSNTGIGLALAVQLARLNPAHLILAVRDLKKGETAKDEIIAQTGFAGVLEVWQLDMAELASVKGFADRANSTLKRLDGAVLNAGINNWKWETTGDGWEKLLQVNVLSTGLLGVLLLPLLESTAKLPSLHPNAAQLAPHLTITGSNGMFLAKFAEKSAPNMLKTLNTETGADMFDRYPTSKLFAFFIAREIAKLPRAKDVVVNIVSPGLCSSDLGRDLNLGPVAAYLVGKLSWSTSKGALNLLYGVLRPTPPAAYISGGKVEQVSSWIRGKEAIRAQEQLWAEMLAVWREVAPEVVDFT